MRTPGIVQRHPELRWLASVAVIAAAGITLATSVSGVFRDDDVLSATSPEMLIAQLRTPHLHGYSGTVGTHVNLGLPDPVTAAVAAAAPIGGGLLSGSHTMRYWYGGPDRQRVAVIGQTSEQDVFRNGANLVLWDTATRIAQRSTTSDRASGLLTLAATDPAALTPPQLASRILELAADTSDTALRSGDRIADRPTYELVLRPESPASLVESVHIEVDGREAVALGVQIFARGVVRAAVDVSFNTVNFAEPDGQNFSFTPPADAEIRPTEMRGPLAAALENVSMIGSGWLRVASYHVPRAAVIMVRELLGKRLHPVHGQWGTGRLLQSPVLSVLVTDRGRVLAGAVAPSVLYRAAR